MAGKRVRLPEVVPRRQAVDRVAQEIEREFVRGIFWLGVVAFPLVAALALATSDASIALISALVLTAVLISYLQLRRERATALPVVLVVVTIAAAQLPVQSSENRAAMMVAVAALGALGGLFVERRWFFPYVGYLSLVWAAQLAWAADQGLGVFEEPGDNQLFGMAVQLSIFVVVSVALNVTWREITGSEKGYRNLFDRAPTSIWEEDYSEVLEALAGLRRDGVTDLRGHLAEHPETIADMFRRVRVKDVNEAAVALVQAESRQQLLGHLDPRTADHATLDAFVEQLMAIWEGRDRLVADFSGRTFLGRQIDCVLHWSVPAGPHGPDYSRVLVSISDVSDLVSVQRELSRKNALLNSIASSQSRFIAAQDPQQMFEGVLADLLELTGSRYGLIAEVHRHNGRPELRALAQSGGEAAPGARLSVEDLDVIFREVLDTGHPVIGNGPLDAEKDFPGALPPLSSFLGLPLQQGGELVGTVAVANRQDGYTPELLTAIDPFVAACGNLVVAARAERLRREAEEARHRAEKRLRLIAENVGDLLYTVNGDGLFTFVSGSAERMLGYHPEDLIGTSARDLIHPDDLEEVRAAASGVRPGESTRPVERRVRHRNRSWRLLEATSVNMLDDPDVEAWVVNARDVTARKEAEVQLQRAREAAEQAAASKAQFLANISHEIRTPMNAILGMTELALGTELTAEQREYLGTTKTSVEALLTLINDLLDLSKIEAGRLDLEEIPFSLGDTIGDTVRTMAVRAAEKGLELAAEVDPSVPDAVVGDPGRLRQILFNLLGNAIKFTHVGHVRMKVEASSSDGLELLFSIEDTGIGIPADMHERIFESFSQADESTTRRYGGTGLGLAITADLVRMMEGRIWVESEVGVGSTFRFTARLAEATLADISGPPADLDAGDLRVLIIADAVSTQRNLHEMLRQGQVSTTVAADLASALDTIHDLGRLRAAPRCVIVDVRENILEVCARLVTSPEFRGVPVIAIPVAGERGDAARFREVGAAAYLTKPVNQGELLDTVRLVTSGRLPAGTLVTKHWLRERRPRLRVLLADDSPTNRTLAERLLEKRGHLVVSVENGVRAVEAVQEEPFDVVLMDVQMPELDGLEATRYIRRWEEETGAHIPIVALTAHAMEADRRRCLEAGMDAYVSKPFSADELYATIEQLVVRRPEPAGEVEAPAPGVGTVIDRKEALERVEGMADLLEEMAGLFLDEYPDLHSEITTSLARGEVEGAGQAAHRIKGTVGLFAARGPLEAATRMNNLAKAGDLGGVEEAWRALEQQMNLLIPELRTLAERGIAAWS